MPPVVARISAEPLPVVVARPLEEFTVATGVFDEDQSKDLPEIVAPEASFAVAVNCWVVPMAVNACSVGETSTLATTGWVADLLH